MAFSFFVMNTMLQNHKYLAKLQDWIDHDKIQGHAVQ